MQLVYNLKDIKEAGYDISLISAEYSHFSSIFNTLYITKSDYKYNCVTINKEYLNYRRGESLFNLSLDFEGIISLLLHQKIYPIKVILPLDK